jgi:hypothetical protein
VNPFAIALVSAILAAPSAGALTETSDPGPGYLSLTSDPGSTALTSISDPGPSDLRDRVERFTADRAALYRRYDVDSPTRHARLRTFYREWEEALDRTEYDGLNLQGKIDYQLLRNRLGYEVRRLDMDGERYREALTLLPFLPSLIHLHETRRNLEPVDPRESARILNEATASVNEIRRSLEGGLRGETGASSVSPVAARRASARAEEIRRALSEWYGFHHGSDPLFTWWVSTPYETFHRVFTGYVTFLREQVAGVVEGTEGDIIGDPIGEAALLLDLEAELIPYAPNELIRIAQRELAWGLGEMRRASRELGYGDDWHAALEHVKTLHVEPGRQTELVVELAREAEEFLESRELITIDPLAKEIWRMEMLSAERQRFAPFFLGGETVQVAFPTLEQSHDEKSMSLRANNRHFSRAVVQHELIPGHHLQGYMTQRYSTHRAAFATPFWGEGWALHWEFLLWDLDFPRGPEDRIGMLFWRNHRAARIIFSLSFHLGTMTPEEAIDFLVEQVGHERNSAAAEVRRSFEGDYSPLYQVAYMIGGLQFRQLYRDLVESGQMTSRDFHDHILKAGRIPVEMVRASLTSQAPPRDFVSNWRFYPHD